MKIVAFDLDDTLVPEALFIRSGIRHIAGYLKQRFPGLSEHRIITCMDAAVFTRRNHYSALEDYLRETGLNPSEIMEDAVREFRHHTPDPDFYHPAPSTVGILEDLQAKGVRLALVTDGRSITQRNKIKAAGLSRFFDDDDIYISGRPDMTKTTPTAFSR